MRPSHTATLEYSDHSKSTASNISKINSSIEEAGTSTGCMPVNIFSKSSERKTRPKPSSEDDNVQVKRKKREKGKRKKRDKKKRKTFLRINY